jgi:hypothetical protein
MREMQDRNISITAAVAILLWIVAAVFICLAWAEHPPPGTERHPYATTGLFFACSGGVLSIKAFITHHEQSMKEMQRNWFTLGRDSSQGRDLRIVNDQ